MKINQGFSLLETLITVAVIGVLAAIGTVTVGHVVSSSKSSKLESDVATLNRSVVAYLATGGDLSSVQSADEVLATLKRSNANASRTPGLAGAKLDASVSFVMQTPSEAASGGARVYWDESAQRFRIAMSGEAPGIKAFAYDRDLAELDFGEEASGSPFLYAAGDNWIWDYAEAPPHIPLGSSDVPLAPPVATSPPPATPVSSPGPGGVTPLSPPQFSIPGGEYLVTEFSLNLALANPNPLGSSDIYYSVNFGDWQRYNGAFLVAPGSAVAAQVIALNDAYANSHRVDEIYEVLPLPLDPPEISSDLAELGLFVGRTAIVTISNPNPSAFSKVEYRISGGPWQDYEGPFMISRDDYPLGTLIQARTTPLEEHYLASSASLKTLGVEALSLAGEADGAFSNPSGAGTMVTNLSGGQSSSYFEWGRDYLVGSESTSARLSKSWMEFQAESISSISASDPFRLGSLLYYNGTIISGTGAQGVSFAVDLDLSIQGISTAISFQFDFELIDTPNLGIDPWADADYVRISNVFANEVIEIQGVQFKLQIEFADASAAGIAAFDEFHVLEEHQASTGLYGTLVELGSVDFNRSP